MIAAGMEDIRKWFIEGVKREALYMLIVFDRMDFLDGPDSPYYVNSIERAHSVISEFRSDPMCTVMEVYDLTADMEAQLAEKRAWNLPELPQKINSLPASGLLASGKTRIDWMEAKNRAYLLKRFAEAKEINIHYLDVFADEDEASVKTTSVYLLEKAERPAKTSATVYLFDENGGAGRSA